MHYISYRRDGSVIGDYRHGCWGMLSTHFGKSKENGGVDKIYWEIDSQTGISSFMKEYGCTAQEFFLTLLKGYDVEFTMSNSRNNPTVVGVTIKNLWDRNPQETMLRLFGLRTAVYLYNKQALVKLCKEHGLPLTAAVVVINCFAPKVSNALAGGGEITGVAPQLQNGGNIGYYNTTVSDFRRFLKGEFTPNKKLHLNDTTWGEAKGYTSGTTGRFVQEACSHAPMGTALLCGYFIPGVANVSQGHMYENSYINRRGKNVYTISSNHHAMGVEEFFDFIKAILHKKKLPVQRALPFYVKNNSGIRASVLENVNPFLKNMQL